jgi:TolA-binding protein
MRMNYWIFSILFVSSLFLWGCGGGEEEEIKTEPPTKSVPATDTKGTDAKTNSGTGEDVASKQQEEKIEPLDPNGFYSQTGGVSEGKPIYTDVDGFFLWFDGGKWNLSDKMGGGKIIASSDSDSINNRWSVGSAVTHPDETYVKDATFRLAVTYQLTSEYDNAYKAFSDFVTAYNDDALVADCYLSLGDIVFQRLPSDDAPPIAKIKESQEYYEEVRKRNLPGAVSNPKLVNDSTFNEADMLEKVATPPSVVDEVLKNADKDGDDSLSKSEFNSVEQFSNVSWRHADADGDDKIDDEEIANRLSAYYYTAAAKLYKKYKSDYKNLKGAQLSHASHKLGIIHEKLEILGETPDPLDYKEYKEFPHGGSYLGIMFIGYEQDIKTYGEDPASVGTDKMLKVYAEKHNQYNSKYTQTLDVLKALENKNQAISFTLTTRTSTREVTTTVQKALDDRRELIGWLNSFSGIDDEVRTYVISYRQGLDQEKQKDWLNAKRDYFSARKKNFDNIPHPGKLFKALFHASPENGTLALRMRWILDEIGDPIGGYAPNKAHFSAASPSVLLWMGRKAEAGTATAALQRLIAKYPDSGEFVYDALIILGDAEFRSKNSRGYKAAEPLYAEAYNQFAYDPRAFEAQMKLGNTRLLIGKGPPKDTSKLVSSEEVFGQVMDNQQLAPAVRAEAIYKMGQARAERNDYVGAVNYYRQVYNGFPGAVEWSGKSYEAAIICYEEKLGELDNASKLKTRQSAWKRRFAP